MRSGRLPRGGGPQRRPRRGRRRRATPARASRGTIIEEITLSGEVNSHALEALRLEIRRLARRLGVRIDELCIETVEAGRSR